MGQMRDEIRLSKTTIHTSSKTPLTDAISLWHMCLVLRTGDAFLIGLWLGLDETMLHV